VALGHALASAGLPERFFGRAVCTGGHRASLQAVLSGAADLAAIDCVSFALLERAEPAAIAGVRVVAESEPAPALPYVTAAARPAADRTRLLGALMDAVSDPTLATARDDLLLDGFLPIEGDSYARSIAMAETAAGHLQALVDALAMTASAADRSSMPA
jgi:ABC-type phosphate/phosphonate transport system substrate-binding protein